MWIQLLYILGFVLLLPFLPLLWFQGRWVRASIPPLPDPTGPQDGLVKVEGTELKVLVMGNSSVAGIGVETMEQSLAAHFARNLSIRLGRSVRWKIFAESGLTAEGLRKKLISKPFHENYDLVIICVGGNDAFSVHSPRRWKRDCLALVQEVRKHHDGSILFSDIPPVKDFPAFTKLMQLVLGTLVRLYRHSLQQIVSQEKDVHRVTIPLAIHVRPGKTIHANFSDGVHPSEITYSDWADDLAITSERIL